MNHKGTVLLVVNEYYEALDLEEVDPEDVDNESCSLVFALITAFIRNMDMEDLFAAWAAFPKPAVPEPRAMFETFVRFHIRHHLQRGAAVFISYMELRNLAPENFARVETMRRSYESILTEILEAGQRAGVFRLSDPKLATFALIAMLTGVNTWYRPGGRLESGAIEAVYLEMARNLVGERQDALA